MVERKFPHQTFRSTRKVASRRKSCSCGREFDVYCVPGVQKADYLIDVHGASVYPPGRRRRGIRDPLRLTNEARWLVIRDKCSKPLEYRELCGESDLRGALESERAQRMSEGWNVEEIPRNCAFCFASRGQDRVCISIQCFELGTAGLGHG